MKVRNIQLGFRMPGFVDEDKEREIAETILKGAKVVDTSAAFAMDYIQCREALHRYCKRHNPEAYRWLTVEAAHIDESSPHITVLQQHSTLFLPGARKKTKDKRLLEKEIQSVTNVLTNQNLNLRIKRIELALLKHELQHGI
ncbi:hypothetical protein [Endozoicomonas lisbonensis]|uniref:NADP-dependent oxidoreductase domain-containing protein n=1 Tax=Endozoicomonas lisbonensis TaxID=3120522 RepID=A0ABV2SP57_9GAMM